MATKARNFRTGMMLSTALAALVAMPGVAHAQLVTSGDLVDAIDNGGNPGQLTVTDVSATQTDMTVLAPVVIANWNRFNVPTGTTVNIANGSAAPSATLVNRVIGATPSDIGGTINAADINLWLINQNGILFGGGTAINSASFVASTLDAADLDLFQFIGGASSSLNMATASNAAISGGGAAASFVTDGSLLFLSQQLDLDATFNAGTGNIAFVTASNVTVGFTPGSPLSFTLNAGTTVAEQTIAGSVTGNSIDIQMLTASGVVGALLNVDAALNATTAVATENGVRLLAIQNNAASVTVEMTGGITSTGIVDLQTDGTLEATSPMSGSRVFASATGGITLNDASATAADVTLLSEGAITTGAVTASALVPADGLITIGSIAGGALQLGALQASGATILNTTGTITTAGITAGGALTVGAVSEPSSVTFNGAVSASSITIDTGGALQAAGLTAMVGGIDIDAASINAGAVSATGGDVDLVTTGNITTASITSTTFASLGGAIDVGSTSGGTLNLGALQAGRAVDIDTSGNLSTGGINAGGALTVGAVAEPALV